MEWGLFACCMWVTVDLLVDSYLVVKINIALTSGFEFSQAVKKKNFCEFALQTLSKRSITLRRPAEPAQPRIQRDMHVPFRTQGTA